MHQDMNRHASHDENSAYMWACLCHFSALLGLIWWVPAITVWVPFGHLAGPLAVWLFKRKDSPFIDEAGKESINFQILMSVYGIACAAAFMHSIGKFLVMGLVASDAFFVVTAGLNASKGKCYRYPLVVWRLFG